MLNQQLIVKSTIDCQINNTQKSPPGIVKSTILIVKSTNIIFVDLTINIVDLTMPGGDFCVLSNQQLILLIWQYQKLSNQQY